MDCEWAKDIWETALGQHVLELRCGVLKDWAREILCQKSDKERQLFAMVTWAIWSARNELVHNHLRQSPEKTVEFVIQYVQQFDDTVQKSSNNAQNSSNIFQNSSNICQT